MQGQPSPDAAAGQHLAQCTTPEHFYDVKMEEAKMAMTWRESQVCVSPYRSRGRWSPCILGCGITEPGISSALFSF